MSLNPRPHFQVPIGSHTLSLGTHTAIMGIINLTPDSFSKDGLANSKNSTEQALIRAQKMIKEGADLLDIGGESTRPGSKPISAKEEIRRVIPVIKKISSRVKAKTPISVDTYKPLVAQYALDAGAAIINNIMGTPADKELLKMVRNYNAAMILMHIRGKPRTMQKNILYQNLIKEIIRELKSSIEKCLEIGIKSDKIIIDPGIGFGKTPEHNLAIINRLEEFQVLKKPILIGTSRKSFIGRLLNKEAEKRIFGTIASVCVSVLNGAHIVRVHDVAAVKDAVLVMDAILQQST